jgi:hypothetical protein
VAPRTRAEGRGPAGPWSTDRHRRLAGEGPGACEVLSAGSSRLEPRRLVARAGIASAPAPAAAHPGPRRSMGHGCGRPPGAPPWHAEPGARACSRSGALRPQRWGQRQRVALVEPAALGPHALGHAGRGRARRDGAGPCRAFPSGPWPTAHEAAGLGPAQAPGGAARDARAPPRAGHPAPWRRGHLAVAAESGGAAPLEPHARAAGCRALRPRPAPDAPADGATPRARPAAAARGRGLGPPGHRQAPRDGARLAGCGRAGGRARAGLPCPSAGAAGASHRTRSRPKPGGGRI